MTMTRQLAVVIGSSLAIGALCFSPGRAPAQSNVPPAGFVALFDGKTLDGWWGAKTEDPRDYLALDAQELAAKKKASLEDIRAHWRVEDGELVNDGQGLFLTSDRFFGDFELLASYKMSPGGG